jgi:erythromycin esterase
MRRSFRALRCFAVVLAIAGLAPLCLAAQTSPLPPGVYPLAGHDPALPSTDLQPLKKIVGNARFVGLGEADHTSGGFYEMKHRVIRYLIEERGFRVLGFENPWRRSANAIRYVETCEGTPEQALVGMFGVWRSVETVELLRYMCEWNQAHPQDKVHFYGFDIQFQTPQDVADLTAFLTRIGLPASDPRVADLQACDGAAEAYYPNLAFPEELYNRCQGALSAIWTLFDSREREIARQTSREDLAWARVFVVGQQAWQEELFYWEDYARSSAARDRGMAYVVEAIRDLRFPRERVALWAHNGHLWKDGIAVEGFKNMGTHLAESLGRSYVAIGLVAYDVGFAWPDYYCGYLPYGEALDSAEEHLRALGLETALVDLDPRGSRPRFFQPGAVHPLGYYPMVPADQFDALIYLDSSPPMTSLWIPCP